MVTNPDIEILNQRLKEVYGLFEDKPRYRIAWSEDQFEYRLGKYNKFDEHGNFLGVSENEEFQYVPKYRQWIQNKWVLEVYLPVPPLNRKELVTKLSYEPLQPFKIQPSWRAIQFIIELVRQQAANKVKVKYEDPLKPLSDPKIAMEVKEDQIKKLVEELFPNETDVGDALAYKEGVTVPHTTFGEEV